MDCAKAIALAARYPGDVWEDFWARPGVIDFDPLPLGVIVTVAGTGSECNGGAVITHPGKKVKTGRDYPQLNPRFALMDPTYTYSVPQAQMISGGFDTLSHLMEIDPPTFACVGERDGIANWRTMERRLQALSALGIPTEFHHYPGLSHGFGLGTGTVAEGWLDQAVAFWEANTSPSTPQT